MIGLYPGEAGREQGAAEECLTNEPNNAAYRLKLLEIYRELDNSSAASEQLHQLRAIGETLIDMSNGTPMDRLVCGDVGFGKTEVAMRAAFVAAMSGVQVAVIAPTTLLARQHAKGFKERFRVYKG